MFVRIGALSNSTKGECSDLAFGSGSILGLLGLLSTLLVEVLNRVIVVVVGMVICILAQGTYLKFTIGSFIVPSASNIGC